MVCPSRFPPPRMWNSIIEIATGCSSAIIVNPRYGDRQREIDLRPWNRAREISTRSLVHVLDFSRSDSIIIHPPSPPSARLNYPGLNEGWIEPAASPWKKKKQAVEEKQIGGKSGHACIAGRRWI